MLIKYIRLKLKLNLTAKEYFVSGGIPSYPVKFHPAVQLETYGSSSLVISVFWTAIELAVFGCKSKPYSSGSGAVLGSCTTTLAPALLLSLFNM